MNNEEKIINAWKIGHSKEYLIKMQKEHIKRQNIGTKLDQRKVTKQAQEEVERILLNNYRKEYC